VRFAEERDIGGVISTTFLFLRETWRELGLGLLYVAGPVLLLTAVASYFLQTRMFGLLGELEQSDPNDPAAFLGLFSGLMGPSYVLAVLGGLVAGVLVTAVVFGYVRLYRAGGAGRVSPGVLWAESSHLLGRSLRVWLLIALVVTLCVAGMALFCLGLVVLIALLPALSLAVPGSLLGGRSVRDAFGDGWRLASRAWLPSLGVVLVSGLIWYSINVALSLPSSIAGMMVGLNSAEGDFSVTGTARGLMAVGTVLGAFGYLFYTIPLVAIALHYFSLTEGESGGGLIDRVAELEQASAEEPTSPPPLPGAGGTAPGFRGRGFDDET
jgi:hypothetical protein